ncbi:MAG: type II toxin-antitoxin system HicB family antitoxin [Thermoguttaceae bacterium]
MSHVFTAYIEYDPEAAVFVGTIPGLPGAHSQGATLDELNANLQEVVELILEEQRSRGEPIVVAPFVGIQQIAVEA